MKFRQSMQWVCVAGVALLAAACGGGGGGGDAPAPDMSTASRIEPFDPTLGKALKALPPDVGVSDGIKLALKALAK